MILKVLETKEGVPFWEMKQSTSSRCHIGSKETKGTSHEEECFERDLTDVIHGSTQGCSMKSGKMSTEGWVKNTEAAALVTTLALVD